MVASAKNQVSLDYAAGSYWSACSAQGAGRVRNADAFAVGDVEDAHFFAVADGVGSLPGSAAASRAAVSAIGHWAREGLLDADSLIAAVHPAVADALRQAGEEGASTLACAVWRGSDFYLASVGDSEILAVEQSGAATLLHQLDHLPNRPNVLLSWLDGKTPFRPHIMHFDKAPYLLCFLTDGISRVLDYETIATSVRKSDISAAARDLVIAAQEAGAQDDVTAIVLMPGAHRNAQA